MDLEEPDELLCELPDPDGQLVDAAYGDLEGFTISERWLNTDLALHVHLRVRSRLRELQPQDLCLVFVREFGVRPHVLHELGGGIPADSTPKRFSAVQGYRGMKGTVLVNVGELAETGQVVLTRVRASVRLRVLNECPDVSVGPDTVQGAHAPSSTESDGLVKLGSVIVDGELRSPVGCAALQNDELPDEVIQRRACMASPQMMLRRKGKGSSNGGLRLTIATFRQTCDL